jgi:hypothetical protein
VAVTLVLGFAACSSPPSAAPAAPARSSTPAVRPAAQQAETVPVKLSTLDTSGREQTEPSRNPFRFQPKVVVPPPRAAAPEPPSQQVRPMPVAPPVPAGPPPIALKFLGVVTRSNGVRWAVLSDGKLTVYGRETDIIDGQYRIVSIGTESIELTYADGRGRQTVKLSGQ